MARQGDRMIWEAQVPEPPADTPLSNAPEAGEPFTPGPINNMPRPSPIQVSHLFAAPSPPLTHFFSQLLSR